MTTQKHRSADSADAEYVGPYRLLRKLALGGLAVVAAKVVFVDLSEVAIAYRVLSFVGLGACLLLGAIAYGRALARTVASDAGPLPDHNG